MHGPGHGKNARRMLQIIGETILGKFSFDGITGTSHAVAVGTAALDHEARNYPVEDQAVIEPLLHQVDKIVDSIRSNLRI